MKLTKTQIDLLDHHLSAGVIAEVLAETEDLAISLAEAEKAVDTVDRMVASGDLPLESLSRVELEVVIDCLEGSTYFCGEGDAIALGETTRGRQAERHKAANALEKAVSAAAGRQVLCTRE